MCLVDAIYKDKVDQCHEILFKMYILYASKKSWGYCNTKYIFNQTKRDPIKNYWEKVRYPHAEHIILSIKKCVK